MSPTLTDISSSQPSTAVAGSSLISPWGGSLCNLKAAPERHQKLAEEATSLPRIVLDERAVCDLVLLSEGAFSPLDRFLGEADYHSVLDSLRLADGTLFPMPVTLPVTAAPGIEVGRRVALYSSVGDLLAVMTLDELYPWDRQREALAAYGTLDAAHPMVAEIEQRPDWLASGPVEVLQRPSHHDFSELRLSPAAVRRRLHQMGRSRVVAFQTRNPLHRVHEELTKRAIEGLDAVLLLHPVVGLTQPGDIDHITRVRTYRALVEHHYDPRQVLLALLPLAMRMAGPREALWHALIRRNFGADHLIVGRDHASPRPGSSGLPFYPPYAAQELLAEHSAELGVTLVPFQELVYLPDLERFEERDQVPLGIRTATLSGTQVRQKLAAGEALPKWFTRPEVAQILAERQALGAA